MTTIQVFDPALCCASGVCGVSVDQELVRFSADVEAIRKKGGTVERFNLSQEPLRFVQTALVAEILEREGEKALPIVLSGARILAKGHYPSREEMERELGLSPAPSHFTAAVAELVAIGAAVSARCDSCFRLHRDRAIALGVSAEEIAEAVRLAKKVRTTADEKFDRVAEGIFDGRSTGTPLPVVQTSGDEGLRPPSEGKTTCC
ncbi:MAG: arsenical resistance operon trans-acting repressor ArsD [Leptospirillum sp. Group IV 'UBA BS']|jgi:alkylhydroperoxidase AhpD family core domain|nr:MAG: arsenical resistance operon trans-acting repressor ArsD [Leptospirillum sp. Group IV 'UBA BS']MCL5285141.1 arsenite efflux transporter metallochaperone ArsD [Nitrospirota bacterium]